jgi:hypothetical protein
MRKTDTTVEPPSRGDVVPVPRRSRPTRAALSRAEIDRLVNLGLAALLTSAIISGLAAEASGTPAGRWIIIVHGISGLGLVVLSRRKTHISGRALGR